MSAFLVPRLTMPAYSLDTNLRLTQSGTILVLAPEARRRNEVSGGVGALSLRSGGGSGPIDGPLPGEGTSNAKEGAVCQHGR